MASEMKKEERTVIEFHLWKYALCSLAPYKSNGWMLEFFLSNYERKNLSQGFFRNKNIA